MTTKVKKKGVWHIRKLHKGKAELTVAPGAQERDSP